jgi:hypothetical protein
MISSSAFAFVMLSFFRRFLKGTTMLGGMLDRSGGGVMYDSVVVENPPNPLAPPNEAEGLLVRAFPVFADRFIVGDQIFVVGETVASRDANLAVAEGALVGQSQSEEKPAHVMRGTSVSHLRPPPVDTSGGEHMLTDTFLPCLFIFTSIKAATMGLRLQCN